MTSEKGHQLQSEVPEAKKTSVTVVESFPPPQDNNPEVNKEIQNDKPKKKQNKKHSSSEKKTKQFDIEIQKTADDVMQYSNVNEAEKLEEVSTHQKSRNDSTEVSKLGSRLASKSKGKKLDISSSVDTSSNSHSLTTSKKSRESAKIIAQVLSELQNDVQESELSRPIDVHLSQLHQTSQHEDCLETLDTESVKQMVQPKTTFSANVLPEAEQPDVLLTKSNRAAKHSKGTPLTEGHDNDPVEILSQEVSSGSKTTKPEKLTASKRKVKNLDLPTAKDAESKEENSTASNKKSTCGNNSLDGSQLQKSITKSKRVLRFHSSTDHSKSSKDVETQVPTGNQNNTVGKTDATYPNMDGNRSSETSSLISGSSVKRTRMGKSTVEVRKKKKHENVYKTPANKVVEVPVNAVPQKKYVPPTTGGLFGDLSSDSSDGEVIRSGSSSSTRTPDDVSSSDYSEGESKGDVVTSQHDSKGGGSARDKTNTTSSALMEMNLESVLRSSRRYKKAKLVASQSQMEDGESEPPEFVPDSLAYE
ncbi:hypothetical protein RND81_11G009900 [Saponaria officinalis]|uniref:Uncharacterized protein n=1 Tax=Saponaria officinalis TaxID=3572 RepID=A0AAW1HGR5_SAPOF